MMKSPIILNFLMITMFIISFLLMLNFIHPLSMIILMILYFLMIYIQMSTWKYNFIYSMMLYFIMISGLMIIFLYFAMFISNAQNKITITPILLITFTINMMSLSSLMKMKKISIFPTHYSWETNNMFTMNNNLFSNIKMIYMPPYNNMTLFCIIYLLIALFTIIKICSTKNISLRKIN